MIICKKFVTVDYEELMLMIMRMMTMLILEYPKNMGQVIVGGASTSKGKLLTNGYMCPRCPIYPSC